MFHNRHFKGTHSITDIKLPWSNHEGINLCGLTFCNLSARTFPFKLFNSVFIWLSPQKSTKLFRVSKLSRASDAVIFLPPCWSSSLLLSNGVLYSPDLDPDVDPPKTGLQYCISVKKRSQISNKCLTKSRPNFSRIRLP